MDIRTPIGGMFAVLGLVLLGYGLVTLRNTALYAESLGIDMNLWWGLVMLAFGLTMLGLGWFSSRKPPRPAASIADTDRPTPH